MPNHNAKSDLFLPRAAGKRIDWHCHLLPGLDDGAESLAEALEIARILAGAGFSEICCTPHCMRGLFDNTPALVRRAVAELQQAVDAAGIVLRLSAGMEYFLDEYFEAQLEDPLPLGNTGCLLVEATRQPDPERIKAQLFAIRRRGLIPLLAHPERYEFLAGGGNHRRGLLGRLQTRFFAGQTAVTAAASTPDLLSELLAMGCRLQGNLGSFAGIYGSEVRQRAEQLHAAGRFDCFGSDAHRSASLEKILARGLDKVG